MADSAPGRGVLAGQGVRRRGRSIRRSRLSHLARPCFPLDASGRRGFRPNSLSGGAAPPVLLRCSRSVSPRNGRRSTAHPRQLLSVGPPANRTDRRRRPEGWPSLIRWWVDSGVGWVGLLEDCATCSTGHRGEGCQWGATLRLELTESRVFRCSQSTQFASCRPSESPCLAPLAPRPPLLHISRCSRTWIDSARLVVSSTLTEIGPCFWIRRGAQVACRAAGRPLHAVGSVCQPASECAWNCGCQGRRVQTKCAVMHWWCRFASRSAHRIHPSRWRLIRPAAGARD
ncbi:hypothetical protein B0T11DRAFT_315388 [Plectosphaerella cucumerina]|uniref:Uncharacterized protein n=1 Tax=Plectosphaerella cucumerina TaxID=40658 RepID=A0A8K0X512_9PEZI|nr:hypothetical protein B0T11DRAFT_315388 [Plectosphaerella cucumerina]